MKRNGGVFGHCCRAFSLCVPYEELKANPSKFKDGDKILDMIIPLGVLSDADVKERFGISAITSPGSCAAYTCRHLQENGDCGIYESRPQMCRDYPGPKLAACLWKECEASCGIKAKMMNVFGDMNYESKQE